MSSRVEKVDFQGCPGWLKRVERPSLRMRLQKGDARKNFQAECAALIRFGRMGLPVPRLLILGEDHFISEDAGPSLRRIRRDAPQLITSALQDAARALARLLAAGVSHGRPAQRDICWRAGQAVFIDLERAGRARPGRAGQVDDCLVFFYDIVAETGGLTAELRAARDAYIGMGMGDVWLAARARWRRLRPIMTALCPLSRLLHRKRDFRALLPFVAFMNEALAEAPARR